VTRPPQIPKYRCSGWKHNKNLCDNRALARTRIFEPKGVDCIASVKKSKLCCSGRQSCPWFGGSWLAVSPTNSSFDGISFPLSLKLEDLAQGSCGRRATDISKWLARKCTEKAGLFAGVLLKGFGPGANDEGAMLTLKCCWVEVEVTFDRSRPLLFNCGCGITL